MNSKQEQVPEREPVLAVGPASNEKICLESIPNSPWGQRKLTILVVSSI